MLQSTFVLPHAPFVVLAFFGTGAALLALVGGALVARALRKGRLAAGAFLAAMGLGICYLATLLGFALSSRDEVLRGGAKKYFCEIDCHVAYSVDGVRRSSVVGPLPGVRAAGIFHVVRLRTWFDPSTISPSLRGNGVLTPNPRAVWVLDDAGRRYGESPAAERAVDAAEGPTPALSTPLRPGESYTTRLVFDLPRDVVHPRLLVAAAPGVEALLIGHENSPLHGKITFALDGD